MHTRITVFNKKFARLGDCYHTGYMHKQQIKLRDARLDAGLTQAELAQACNTTTMQIWRFEKNHRPVTLHWARILAPVLKVEDPNWLVSDPADFPNWGLGRPAGRKPQHVEDGDEFLGQSEQAPVERILMLLWRTLPSTEQDAVLQQIMNRAVSFVRDNTPRPNGTGQHAVNV